MATVLCLTLMCSCHSSITEAKIPTGPMPTPRYGLLETYAASLEEKSVASISANGAFESVLSEYALFDYAAKQAEHPGYTLYDCAAADYDPARSLIYYYYRLSMPVGRSRYSMLTFVGRLNVLTGEREDIIRLDDSITASTETVGGEDYEADEITIVAEVEKFQVNNEDGDEQDTTETASIIETPGSSQFSIAIENAPDLIVKLADSGELMVLNGSRFWIYRPDLSLDWEFRLDDARAGNDVYAKYQNLLTSGWTMNITEAVPLLVNAGENRIYEIFFTYSFEPPTIGDADLTPPETPELTATPAIEVAEPAAELSDQEYGEEILTEEQQLQRDYGGNRPFVYPMRLRREVVTTELETASEGVMQTERNTMIGIFPLINDAGFPAHMGFADYEGGHNVRELRLFPAGNPETFGFMLVTTPQYVMVYNAWTQEYTAFATNLTVRNMIEYIRANGLDPADYNHAGAENIQACYFNFKSVLPFNFNGAVPDDIRKSFLLRADKDMMALLQIEYSAGRFGQVEINRVAFDTDGDYTSWDYEAQMFSQRNVAAYNDPDFMTPGKTLIAREAAEYGDGFAVMERPYTPGSPMFRFQRVSSPVWTTGEIEKTTLNMRDFTRNPWLAPLPSDSYLNSVYFKNFSNNPLSGDNLMMNSPQDPGYLSGVISENIKTSAALISDVKKQSAAIALHASLETGLSVCYIDSSSKDIQLISRDGRQTTWINPPMQAHYLIEGVRVGGAYFGVYPITAPEADCVVVGYLSPDRTVIETDLKDANVMAVRISPEPAVEQDWIFLSEE